MSCLAAPSDVGEIVPYGHILLLEALEYLALQAADIARLTDVDSPPARIKQ